MIALSAGLCLQAIQSGQAGLVEQLQGMWCDALPLLVVWEWGRARHAIAEPHNVSTATAVQAWLQVTPQLVYFSMRLLLCKHRGAYMHWPGEEVGDGLLSSVMVLDSHPEPC